MPFFAGQLVENLVCAHPSTCLMNSDDMSDKWCWWNYLLKMVPADTTTGDMLGCGDGCCFVSGINFGLGLSWCGLWLCRTGWVGC